MIIGFTGTRQGIRGYQLAKLNELLPNEDEIDIVFHGGAIGADETFDSLCAFRATSKVQIWPCSNDRYLYWINKGDGIARAVHAIRPPLVRNRIIVDRSDRMFACPVEHEIEHPRGGTWSTIRYARKQNKPLTIIYPDGTIGS